MSVVYVISKSGNPLMPTTRCGHVRFLLKEGKSRVVERVPFTIQLAYETEEATQGFYLGIDPGRTDIGVSVVRTHDLADLLEDVLHIILHASNGCTYYADYQLTADEKSIILDYVKSLPVDLHDDEE